MLDLAIYLGLFIAILFIVIAHLNFSYGFYWLAAVIFVILSIGILTSGWETYDIPSFVVNDVNKDFATIQAQSTIFPATLSENPIYFAVANFFAFVGLALIFIGLQERNKNQVAESME